MKLDKRKHKIVIGVSVLLLVLISLLSINSIRHLREGALKAESTARAIVEMETLISALKKAETNYRGYLITADHRYAFKADSGYRLAGKLLKLLRKTTSSDAVMERMADSLQRIITYRLSNRYGVFNNKSSLSKITNRLELKESLDTLVDTRRIVREMQLRKYDLLTSGIVTIEKYSHYSTVLSVIVALIIIISTFFLYRDLEKDFNRRVELEREKQFTENKDEFLTIASHELKTPLTSMKGYIQILSSLARKKGDTELEPWIHKVNRQVEKLTALVRDLVTISKINLGQIEYHFSEFSFKEVLEDVEIYAKQLSDKHRIEVTGDPDIQVKADKNKLEQVLGNLISNAIKYSNGSPDILINVASEDDELRVKVTDFGIGIPKEIQRHVFDRFYRVKERDYYASGLGIGLYISAEIIKRHHGSLTLESEPGKGSTFILELPLDNQ